MLENGKYRGRATNWALGTTSTGKEQVAVAFSLLDDHVTGQSITWYGYFTDGTFDRTIGSLRHCGWEGDDLTDLQGLDANEVELVVEQEEYNGQWAAKVKWVNRFGAAVKSQMAPDTAKAFASRMKGRIVALRQSGGARPQDGNKRPTSSTSRSGGGPLGPEPPSFADSADDLPPF